MWSLGNILVSRDFKIFFDFFSMDVRNKNLELSDLETALQKLRFESPSNSIRAIAAFYLKEWEKFSLHSIRKSTELVRSVHFLRPQSLSL